MFGNKYGEVSKWSQRERFEIVLSVLSRHVGSNPTFSATRLSLDAIRVLGLVFFIFPVHLCLRWVSSLQRKPTSEQSPLCSGLVFCLRQNIRYPPATSLLIFYRQSRSARLFGCKRLYNSSLSLPTFCKFESSIPAAEMPKISFSCGLAPGHNTTHSELGFLYLQGTLCL